MKNGKKPTLAQKKFLQGKGLVPENWLIVKSDYESHGEKSHSNAGRTGKRVERSASLLPVASVQESQNCDETDAGRFCEAIYRGQKGGWMRWYKEKKCTLNRAA